nr:hypothetical protein [Variovorax boronicumulans]
MSFLRLQEIPAHTTDRTAKGLPLWSGADPVPAIGVEVHINVNRIGRAEVVGYGIQGGYLGVMVYPLDPPPWWIAQNGPPSPDNASLAFGAEVRTVTKGA